MEWEVQLDPDFAVWLQEQAPVVRKAILAHAEFLQTCGPALGRPRVDRVRESNLPNMKELRVQCRGEPWRVLFVFDPRRHAILLVGGNKQGDERWYRKMIPLAEQRYQRHLEELEREHGN